jgi:predicted glycosyltransferase
LLKTYLDDAALRLAEQGFRSVIIGGPDLAPASARSLRSQANCVPHAEWLDFEPCVNCRIRSSELIVSMGGYNTLCQIANNRKPALIVPRKHPRLEQAIRAELWEQRGWVHTLDPDGLKPPALTKRIQSILEQGRVAAPAELDMNGLDRICERFEAFWKPEVACAAPVCV